MAEIARERNATDAGIACGDFGDGVPRAVARAVVHEHELVVDGRSAERLAKRLDERTDVRSLVVERRNDADLGAGVHSLLDEERTKRRSLLFGSAVVRSRPVLLLHAVVFLAVAHDIAG